MLTKVTYSMIQGSIANVVDYGADPTGVTDSSAAIQAALDAKACVLFPNGSYRIETGLNVTADGATIIGDGSTILNFITGLDNVFYINANNVSISDLTVENQPGTNWSNWSDIGHLGSTFCITPMAKGVLSDTTPPIYNIKIDNIIINESVHGRFAFSARSRVYGLSITNVVINANGTNTCTYKAGFAVEHTGLDVQPRDAKIENVQIYDLAFGQSLGSFGFYLSGVRNGEVNNAFLNKTPGTGAYMFVGEYVTGGVATPIADATLSLRNSTFLEVQGDCIAVAGHAQPLFNPIRKTAFSIKNNTIIGDPTDPGATGVRVFTSGGNLEISQNIFKQLAVGVDASYTTGMVVDNNMFNGILYFPANPNFSGRAVLFRGSTAADGVYDSCVSNNIFEQSASEGVQISYSSQNVVRGNLFKDVFSSASTTSDHPGLNIRNNSSDNVIDSNVFGYSGLATPPFRWISIESNGSLGIGIDQRNKITNNTFFASGSTTAAILNGDVTSTFDLVTIIENNTGVEPIYIGAAPCTIRGNNYEFYGITAAPTGGTWSVGDRAIRVPVVGQPKAWSCTVGGTPGTWTSEGNL